MLNSTFWKYARINFIFTAAHFMVFPILAPYIKSLGYSDIQIGWIYAIVPLTIMVVLPILGDLADKIGRRNVILIAIIMEITAFLLYVTNPNLITIIIARFLDSVAVVTLSLITLAKVEDIATADTRGKISGFFLNIKYIANISAPLIGGFLADYYFIKFPFFVSLIVLVFLLGFFYSKKDFHFHITRKDFNLIRDVKYYLSFKQLRAMGFIGMATHASGPVINLFLPLFIVERLGYSNYYIGLGFFAYQLGWLLSGILGKYSDQWGHHRTILMGLSIRSAMFILLMFVNDIYLLFSLLFVMGIGAAMWDIGFYSYMSNIGEKIHHEGLILTSYTSVAKIGGLIAYILSGYIVAKFSFGLLGVISGFAIIIMLVLNYATIAKSVEY